MLRFSNMVFTVIEQTGQRLTRGTPVHAIFDAMGEASDQRGAFHQPLSINDDIVGYGLNRFFKGFTLGFYRRREPRFTPASNRYRYDAIDGFMPGGNLREALFDNPIKADAGNGAHSIG